MFNIEFFQAKGFSPRLFAFLAFTLSIGWPISAQSADGALMTASVCKNQRDAFDRIWMSEKHAVQNVFFMKNDGSIVRTQGAGTFDSMDNVWVTIHGADNTETITPFTYANFAVYFEQDHQSIPQRIFFSTCYGAKVRNPGSSLLYHLAHKYPEQNQSGTSINLLEAPEAACALTGNGNNNLANAEDRSAPGNSNANRHQTLVDELMNEWSGGNNVMFPATLETFQDYCTMHVVPTPGANLTNFIVQTDNAFGVRYRELVSLNTGGNAFKKCGKTAGANAAAVACPK